jgi:Fur family transcriptional regulator, ferric uptake regulator
MAQSDTSTTSRVEVAVAELRRRGERITPARRAVLEILDDPSLHLNAEEIVARVAERAPGVHRATIYRALARLADLELVTHTHVGGSAAIHHLAEVVLRPDPPHTSHAHLQCTTCGRVIDLPADALQSLVTHLADDLDFDFQPEHTALLGTCSTCRRRRS